MTLEHSPRNTKWDGEPCETRHVKVKVGKASKPTLWYANLEGKERLCLQIRMEGQTFLLDDMAGSAWRKVTDGQGSWRYPHRDLSGDIVKVLTDWSF